MHIAQGADHHRQRQGDAHRHHGSDSRNETQYPAAGDQGDRRGRTGDLVQPERGAARDMVQFRVLHDGDVNAECTGHSCKLKKWQQHADQPERFRAESPEEEGERHDRNDLRCDLEHGHLPRTRADSIAECRRHRLVSSTTCEARRRGTRTAYLAMHHSAAIPSRQVIFLPCA